MTVTHTGKHIGIEYHSNSNDPSMYVIKRSKNQYEDIRTGNIEEYNHSTTRAGSAQSLRRSIALFRQMVANNVIDVSACRGITLSYRENVQDVSKLRNDQKNFIRRLRKEWQDFEYLSALEYQERAALHAHMIIVCPEPITYLDYKMVHNCWGKKGSAHVDLIHSDSQITNYLTKDKLDLPLEDAKKVLGDQIDKYNMYEDIEHGDIKIYVEGAGAYRYPSYTHIFTWSTGCKKPDKQRMPYSEALELVKIHNCVNKNTIIVSNPEDDNGFYVYHMYEKYEQKREEIFNGR